METIEISRHRIIGSEINYSSSNTRYPNEQYRLLKIFTKPKITKLQLNEMSCQNLFSNEKLEKGSSQNNFINVCRFPIFKLHWIHLIFLYFYFKNKTI